MEPTERTAVKLLMSSGETRTIDGADSVAIDDAFLMVMRRDHFRNRMDVILTLRSQDVIGAEILTKGVRTAYVPSNGALRS